MTRRRHLLAALATGGVGSVAGCSSITELLSDGSALPEPPTATEWRSTRGTPQSTGTSASGGPGPAAQLDAELPLRDGLASSDSSTLVGEEDVFEVAPRRDPFVDEPPVYRLYAYRLSPDGQERWRRTLAEQEGESGVSLSGLDLRCLGPDHLYVVRPDPEGPTALAVDALARRDGTVVWSQSVDGSMLADAGQPVYHDGVVYVPARVGFLALSADDGTERWRLPVAWRSHSQPTVAEASVLVHGRRLDEDGAEPELLVLDTADGTERWTARFPNAVVPTPTVANGTVYLVEGNSLGTHEGEDANRRRVHALNLADGSEEWTHTYEDDAMADALARGGANHLTVAGDHVYVALWFASASEIADDGASRDRIDELRERVYDGPNLLALNREDGSVAWEATVGERARVVRPLVADEQYLYAEYRGVEDLDRGEVWVFDRATGEEVGQFGPTSNERPLAIANGALYERADESIRIWR